jgi:hypothetical protein
MKKNNICLKTIFLVLTSLTLSIVFTTGCGNGKGDVKNAAQDSTKLPTGQFFTLSDIHFNPFYDSTIVAKLDTANVQEWEAIFLNSTIQNCGAYNYDSNFPLMIAAFTAMSNVNAHPDFVVITGDFLGHNFQSDYLKYAKNNNTTSRDNFITKTIQFIAIELGKHLPGVPIYPVLGNNDDFCGDYLIQPNDPFLPVFAKAWAPYLDSTSGTNTFLQTVPTAGYYSASLPGYPNHVIIGMNSIFYSSKNQKSDTCMATDTTSGQVEMNWVKQTLASCAQQNKKVWFTCHIPLGADVYSSLDTSGGGCAGNIKMMWKSQYNDTFIALENQYKNTIVGGLAGHTHMDEFRVVSDPSGSPISFFHINPSISPIDGNNPGFQLFTYDTASMTMLDYSSYVFQGLQNPSDQSWKLEYDFDKTYNVSQLTGQTMGGVWQSIDTNSVMEGFYMQYYGDGSPLANPAPPTWKSYWCGIGDLTKATFTPCACGESKLK